MTPLRRPTTSRNLLYSLQQHGQRRNASCLTRHAVLNLPNSSTSACSFLPRPRTRLNSHINPTIIADPLAYRYATTRARPADNPDRGPQSSEDTQTDFNTLNVLGATAVPTTSVDECSHDGFILDSGLKMTDGDGVMLIGGEVFVWRPWMASPASAKDSQQPPSQILHGVDLRKEGNGTGGLITGPGMFTIPTSAWGALGLVWPKPDLLIIGTGGKIVPLEKTTRAALQEYGVRIEVLDTRNAASQFNLLATERGTTEVAAAMLPIGFGVRSRRTR